MDGDSRAVVTIDVHQANELTQSGHRYLDVRTPEEFSKGHVDVADVVNVPYMFIIPGGRVKNPLFLDQVKSACTKDDNLVVACNSGARSLNASAELLHGEFKNVKNMGGGYKAWVKNGLAVKNPEAIL
ncbi:hypothetical protein ACHQM5_016561 [Ranunculus cassubicifolius]